MTRPHQTTVSLALLLLALAWLAPTGAFAQARDVAGAKDGERVKTMAAEIRRLAAASTSGSTPAPTPAKKK